MKSKPWITVLMAVLFLNSAGTVLLAFQYVRTVRSLQRLQVQRAWVGREMGYFQSLVNETLAYGQKNPAIMPVLQSFGIQAKSSGSTNSPATSAK